MPERSTLFLGLVRPPQMLGLPILYAVLWIFGSVLVLIWSQSLWAFVLSALAYPVLWGAAQWDPYFVEVVRVVTERTRPTKNRDIWGGDSYGP
ncbi:MAG: type IV secretion system protein VirB3 [Roseinatronobacter sp.]